MGFIGAFFSAFAVYAYQRITEAKERLQARVRELEGTSSPDIYLVQAMDEFLNKEGALDWENKVKPFLRMLQFEIRRSENLAREERIRLANRLCTAIYLVLTAYPFYGKQPVNFLNVSDKLDLGKDEPFSPQRLAELRERVSYLQFKLNGRSEELIDFVRKCDADERQAFEEKKTLDFQEAMRLAPAEISVNSQDKWEKFYAPRAYQPLMHEFVLLDFFQKLSVYSQRIIPSLAESVQLRIEFSTKFKLRKHTLLMIWLSVFILFFGIFLPPGLQSYGFGLCESQIIYVERFLLISTALPYFYICYWVFRKLRKVDFD